MSETQIGEISDRRKSCGTQKVQPSSCHSPVIHHWFNTNSLGKINALRFEDGYLIHKPYSSCPHRAAEDVLIRKMPSQLSLLSLEGLVASYLQGAKDPTLGRAFIQHKPLIFSFYFSAPPKSLDHRCGN